MWFDPADLMMRTQASRFDSERMHCCAYAWRPLGGVGWGRAAARYCISWYVVFAPAVMPASCASSSALRWYSFWAACGIGVSKMYKYRLGKLGGALYSGQSLPLVPQHGLRRRYFEIETIYISWSNA